MQDSTIYGNFLIAEEETLPKEKQLWNYDWFGLNTGSLIDRTEQVMPDEVANLRGDFVVLDSSP